VRLPTSERNGAWGRVEGCPGAAEDRRRQRFDEDGAPRRHGSGAGRGRREEVVVAGGGGGGNRPEGAISAGGMAVAARGI
jgi:hypothetical protein